MSRLRTPDYLAGVAGLVLLVALAPGASPGIVVVGIVAGGLAVALPAVTAACDKPALPVAWDVLTWWASLIGSVVALVRLATTDDRHWGVWLMAAAVLGVLATAFWAMRRQDAPGLRPAREIRHMPAPPVHDPATPPT